MKALFITAAWTIYGMVAIAAIGYVEGCGPFHVEHDVSGTVSVQVQLSPLMFQSFFLTDCQTRVAGQACYNADPATCATCMSNALFLALPVKQ